MNIDDFLARVNAFRNMPLVAAARANDQLADYQKDIEGVMTLMGVDFNVARHVITQRLLRLGITATNTPEQLYVTLTAMALDMLLIGWTAKKFATDGVPDDVAIAEPITAEQLLAWNGKDGPR